MIKFVEKLEVMLRKRGVQIVAKGGNDKAHDRKSKMSRSRMVLDNISAQNFTKCTGLPPKYRDTITAFERIVEKRNDTRHETQFDFARLLLSRQFTDPATAVLFNCDHWSNLLLWVTGYPTLEEMAKLARVLTRRPPPIQ